MITATKTFTFDAGHRLMKHKGKCYNLHGHTYKLEVSIWNEQVVDHNGMVLDFGDLKKIVNDVIDKWDHAMVLNEEDLQNIIHCKKFGYKYETLEVEPTAENMAIYLYDAILKQLPKNIYVEKIKLWETPTSCAEIFGEKRC